LQTQAGKNANWISRGEALFAAYHLDTGWIPKPITVRLPNGEIYTPDFWDPKRQAFLELSATRQAYYHNRQKYELVRATYPSMPFLIVSPDNVELPYDGFTGDLNGHNGDEPTPVQRQAS